MYVSPEEKGREFQRGDALTTVALALIAAIYLFGAWRQSVSLNLSETAGGQMPYLSEASRISEEGITQYLGDRNRMPAIPALLSLLHTDDPVAFFARGKWFAVVTSIGALCLVAWLFLRKLPRAPGVLAVAVIALTIFLPKASFVQAELLYYTLFFVTWFLMCKLLRRPSYALAVGTGVVAGLCYWTKASGWPLIVLFAAGSVVMSVVRKRKGAGDERGGRGSESWRQVQCAGIVAVVFLLVVAPYLLDNKSRFGQYFYNVNSTFFMWCDNWQDAKAFADRYNIGEQYPDAPPERIPSAGRYFETHTLSQAGQRLNYGFGVLAQLFANSMYGRYVGILVVVCVMLAWKFRWRRSEIEYFHVVIGGFTVVMIVAYLCAYAWYAVVAYGDRFLLSLFLPLLFAMRYFLSRVGARYLRWRPLGFRVHVGDSVAVALTASVIVQGGIAAASPTRRTDSLTRFVQFYFNESREAEAAGDLDVAVRGYNGVVQLDPSFAPAHHHLGLIALHAGRFDQAIPATREAVRLDPDNANYLNSLGSAYMQGGDHQDAIATFERAIAFNPNFVDALYNLAGAYATVGDSARAEELADRLDPLSPDLARQMRAWIQQTKRP